MAIAEITSLSALREAEAGCTRCPLYRDAPQVVPGEGPGRAKVMCVGEQPGTDEDLAVSKKQNGLGLAGLSVVEISCQIRDLNSSPPSVYF